MAFEAIAGGKHVLCEKTFTLNSKQTKDAMSLIILHFLSTGRNEIITSTAKGFHRRAFARIEGTKGVIEVEGRAPSSPKCFTFDSRDTSKEPRILRFEKPGRGFWWEADACAEDVKAGRTENSIMPWKVTLRIMEILYEAWKQGGAKFPQDDEYDVS